MTLGAWFHDLSPFLLRFTPEFGIRWYGLAYALGFLIGWLVLRWLARRGVARIPPERVGDAILYAVMGVVIGGRLGYVLFYRPSLLWSFSSDIPWWGVLEINKGGMSSHGGIIGVIIASILIARGWKEQDGERRGRTSALHILDMMALLVPFGLLFGRLANFINGELLGKVVAAPSEPAPWWSVRFPQEVLAFGVGGVGRGERAAKIEALVDRVALPGDTFERGYARLLDAVQHGAKELGRDLEPLISARYPSQLMQAAAEGLLVGIVVWLVARRPRLPGVVGAWFMISYGVLRVVTEVWRLPDTHLAVARIAGLSRGQWLSVGMLVVGVVALVVIARRGGAKAGGWGAAVQETGGSA